jgi:hypothetical protein
MSAAAIRAEAGMVEAKNFLKSVEAGEATAAALLEQDLIRGRSFDTGRKFLPDGLTLPATFGFLPPVERRLLSQIQGRTYAGILGVASRFLGGRALDPARLGSMMDDCMPPGWRFVADPDVAAAMVIGRSPWAMRAMVCLTELLAQTHYRHSIEPDHALDPLWKDLFLFHWREEASYATADEIAWRREDARLGAVARDRAVGDLITLIGALDGLLEAQAKADAAYFAQACGRILAAGEQERVAAGLLHAYRWQHILSGVQVPHFSAILSGMLGAAQYSRIAAALAPLFDGFSVPRVRGEE